MFPICTSLSRTLFPAASKLPATSLHSFRSRAVILPKLPSRNGRSFAQATAVPKSLPSDIPIEEELVPGYNPKRFYHPNPGEILDGRFELKAKIGWGSTSTVWLAQDVRWQRGSKPYVAIKINTCTFHNEPADRHELEISNHLDGAKSDEWGHRYVRTVDDSFEIAGPNGSHLCLVFEPMREPIWLLRRRLGADKATRNFMPFFKLYIMVLLDGLNHLHTKCSIIHADLKLDNILVSFEDKSVIDEFVQGQTQEPMPRKVLDNRTVYLSHNDFGPLRLIRDKKLPLITIFPKIADFGLAQRGDGQEPLIHPIQVDHCHAPEVLLGTGWSYSADVWNFGVMVWDLLAGEELFQKLKGEDGTYSARHHVAEMIALLGPIPPRLVERERNMRHWKWAPEAVNAKSQLCNNAAGFYGGPFFDDDGQFVVNDLIPSNRQLREIVPDCIAEEEVELFLSFIRKMLCWLPEERATAEELRNHPWLDLDRK